MTTLPDPTSHDSYKMPRVLLAIAPAGSLTSDGNSGGLTTVRSKPVPEMEIEAESQIVFVGPGQFALVGSTKDDFKILPMQDVLMSFRFDYLAWSTLPSFSMQLFDPEFDQLLSYFTAARTKSDEYSLYVRFGWGVDGQAGEKYSPTYETTVINMQTSIVPGGMQLSVSSIPKQSVKARANRIKQAISIPKGLPPELIAKVLIELEESQETTVDGLRSKDQSSIYFGFDDVLNTTAVQKTTTPRLEIDPDAACEPLENSNQPALILPAGGTAYGFIRDVLIPRSVPKDPSKKQNPVYCYEESPGVFRWSVGKEARKESNKKMRTYEVGSGSSKQVISYTPREASFLANVLGGEGVVAGVDAAKPKASQGVENRQGAIAGPTNSTQQPTGPVSDSNTRFYRHSYDRTLATLVQKQRARWNQMKNVAYQVDLIIVGDPGIEILDTVRIRMLAGGTMSNLGRYSTPGSSQERETPTLVPYLSGEFRVIGIGHNIDMSGYTTSLSLVYSMEESQSESSADVEQQSEVPGAPESVPTIQSKTAESLVITNGGTIIR